MLGALYPHFDILDDKIVFLSGSQQLQQSSHSLAIGACLLLLGFYCCQFVTVLAPLRREYLGSLALLQVFQVAVLACLAVWHLPHLASSPLTLALHVAVTVCVALAVLYDSAAEPTPPRTAEEKPRLPSASARVVVAAGTHALWGLDLVLFGLPAVAPQLGWTGPLPREGPYGSAVAAATVVAGVARLAYGVRGWLQARRQVKRKVE